MWWIFKTRRSIFIRFFFCVDFRMSYILKITSEKYFTSVPGYFHCRFCCACDVTLIHFESVEENESTRFRLSFWQAWVKEVQFVRRRVKVFSEVKWREIGTISRRILMERRIWSRSKKGEGHLNDYQRSSKVHAWNGRLYSSTLVRAPLKIVGLLGF